MNHKKWKKNPYLYAYVLGTNGKLQCQHDTSFRIGMELLLYICVTMVVQDAHLLRKVREVFGTTRCTLSLVWELHKLDVDSGGSVVRKMEGAGGRVDYHIVATVRRGDEITQYDLGYVYHTTHWKQNTYPPTGALSPCIRALVVPGHAALIEPVRSAVARSWLELSKHEGSRGFTLLMRPQNHHDVVSAALSVGEASTSTNPCDPPDDEASAGTNSCDWVWPLMSDNAPEATTDIMRCIIGQGNLVCPQAFGKEKKIKMVQRLIYSWRLENAHLFVRDRAMCEVISEWLEKLRRNLSLCDER